MALTDNLVAYWKLDESSGNASDSSGNSKTLTNVNTVSYSSAKINNGADFGSSNTNKRLSINDDLGIDGGNISISFWVKMNTEISSGFITLIQHGGVSSYVNDTVWYDYGGGTRKLSFFRQRQNVNGTKIDYNITLGTDNWYHIVYTYDGTNLRGYINGSLVAGPTSASGNGNAGTIDCFNVGALYAYGGYEKFSSAKIDEVGVWSRALSSTEVSTLYNSGNGLQYPFTTTNIKTIMGLDYASVKTVNGLAKASIKSIMGLE